MSPVVISAPCSVRFVILPFCELALPSIQIGLDASALAFAEEIYDAFGVLDFPGRNVAEPCESLRMIETASADDKIAGATWGTELRRARSQKLRV